MFDLCRKRSVLVCVVVGVIAASPRLHSLQLHNANCGGHGKKLDQVSASVGRNCVCADAGFKENVGLDLWRERAYNFDAGCSHEGR
jgi:hypothetical protein